MTIVNQGEKKPKIVQSPDEISKAVPDIIGQIESRQERYGKSYMDFDKMMRYFNISRMPDYDNMAEPYFGFIFMSRPSLNIVSDGVSYSGTVDSNARSNFSALTQNSMTAAFANDKYGRQMLMSLSQNSPYGAWLPNITSKAMTYSVNDIELKTIEKGNTYFGHVIKYGKHSEDHKVSGSISIDFRNDRYLSVLKQMYLWACYIHLVSKSDSIEPIMNYQKNGILDYAASMYYVVTRRNMRELVYWEKIVGLFPTRIPMSIFNYNDGMILEDKITIDFTYGIRSDPCDPSVLLDINMLSGLPYSSIKTRFSEGALASRRKYLNNHERPFVKGDVLAKYPIISVQRNNDGSLKYFLDFEY